MSRARERRAAMPQPEGARARSEAAAALAAALALAWAAPAAATPFGDFHSKVEHGNLKPFAMDLGGLLGGASFHSARALGLLSFEAGVKGAVQFRPDREDTILRDPGAERFGLPLVQAAAGLPWNLDVIVHGGGTQGARVFGGGVRYGLTKSGILSLKPDAAVSAFADKVNHAHFSATHWSLNAAVSFNLPIAHPYAGFGWDNTTVSVSGAMQPGLRGASATARGTRLAAGLELLLFHVRCHAAYMLLHGLPGLDLGAGVRF